MKQSYWIYSDSFQKLRHTYATTVANDEYMHTIWKPKGSDLYHDCPIAPKSSGVYNHWTRLVEWTGQLTFLY